MTQSIDSLLLEEFGHHQFRPKQREAIEAILAKRDVLMVLPTGGGKSLAFQLPTLLMDGVTLIISPLIALMQDQVRALRANGLNAAMLSSAQNTEENAATIAAMRERKLSFVYLSPERLNTTFMQHVLSSILINFFVIDEAHCISEWGHEFREDYRALSLLKAQFPTVPIAAFTATATPEVQRDILGQLRLHNPLVLKGDLFRSNLFISVQPRLQKGVDALLAFLAPRAHESGIIYVSSRKQSEALAAQLRAKGFRAGCYHAGMSKEDRERAFEDFVFERVSITVATIAFGMGIDKSNIRFVVHMSLPKTLENYYQEIGRAGRDGEKAEALLLYGAEDALLARMRIGEVQDTAHQQLLHQKLNAMVRFASAQTCRHQAIARYFSDTIDPCGDACDNCKAGPVEERDITTQARQFLSAIARTHQRFGKSYLIDLVRGSGTQKIAQNGHDTLSVFGIGKEHSKKEWLSIVDRLLEMEILGLGEHFELFLTHEGARLLKGETTLSIAAHRLTPPKKERVKSLHVKDGLFELLRQTRSMIATQKGIPAYLVFSDKTLHAMAEARPQTKEELLEVGGVGEKKCEAYGEAFLGAIGSYM
ncbi:MAG: DNA helicase RecQ [Campylobacterales bacterium]|nr:DNA helicase RecQ [Campylobacterales bacterium]